MTRRVSVVAGEVEIKVEVRLPGEVSVLTQLKKSTNKASQPQNRHHICLDFRSLQGFLNASVAMIDATRSRKKGH